MIPMFAVVGETVIPRFQGTNRPVVDEDSPRRPITP